MIGTYTFRQNGRIIGTSTNLITTEGKRLIRRYLAGQAAYIGQAMAIGTGTTAATVTDAALSFEFDRAEITLVSPDYVANTLVFKAIFPQETEGQINEVGLFSLADSGSDYGSKLLMSFDADTEGWTGGTYTNNVNRIGGDSLIVGAAASATTTASLADFLSDLTGYSNTDRMSLAYNVVNAFTSSIKLRLKTDSSNYYEYTINTPSTGYKVTTFTKNVFTVVGAPSWETIAAADVVVTSTAGGAASIEFDGLRIEDIDTLNPDYVLVSRSVLGTPIVTTDAAPLEIEYTLAVTV